MGLDNFLMILAKFFNVMAWYASIRAVENDSDMQYQQCLTYWVLFSIITILESVLAKLLLWIPFWPYVKGIVTVLLVTPYFDGASYVYNHFISPYVCVNLQEHDALLVSETKGCMLNGFLDAADTHIKDNGQIELIKHVISEESSEFFQRLQGEKHKANEEELRNGDVRVNICSTAYPNKVQREWSCALCLVSTSSPECLIQHRRGRKHKAKEQELKKDEAVANEIADISSTMTRTNRMASFNQITWVNLENLILNPLARSIIWCTWKKPKFGWMKLNTDGSIDRDNAGLGGLFRDYKGDALCAYVSKATRDDIFLVELWAIWRGLVLALNLGIKVIWVESDSMSAVNTINKKQSYGPKASSCLEHIWVLLKRFEKYRVSHSWRETNRAADYLAKMDILESSDVVLWPSDFPHSLRKIIEDDAQGRRYRRGYLLSKLD